MSNPTGDAINAYERAKKMNILLIHPKQARDYSVPVPPIGNAQIVHTTVEALRMNDRTLLRGHRFDVIVLPDWSELPPETIDLLKASLTRSGIMVVL